MRLFLVFFFGLVLLLSGKAQNETIFRKQLTDTLTSQLHVREATGNNDGVDVEKYLKFVGRPKGDSWCAAFTSWNLNAVGIAKPLNPVNAWAPAFANPKYVTWSQSLHKLHKSKDPKPGDCFTLYYSNLKRVGHVGFIVAETGNYYITIEGNTGLSGTREGAGVHKLKRAKDKIYACADYITPYLKTHETAFNIPFRNDVVQLYSENYRIAYNQGRSENGQHAYTQRFDLLQGFYFTNQRLDNNDTGQCVNRFKWQGQYARNSNRDGTFQSVRFNYKRQALSRLQVQRFGTDSTATAATYSGLQNQNRAKQKGTNYLPRKGSPLYTRMG